MNLRIHAVILFSLDKLESLSEIHSLWGTAELWTIHLGSRGCFGYELLDREASLMDILLAKETLSTKGCFQSAVVVACLGKHSHLVYAQLSCFQVLDGRSSRIDEIRFSKEA